MVKEKIINIPNLITGFRFFFIPLMIYFILNGNNIYAATTYLVFFLIDTIDGAVARRFKQETNFGKYFDIITDTVMMISVLSFSYVSNILPLVIPLLILLYGVVRSTRYVYCFKKRINYKKTHFIAGILIIHALLIYTLLNYKLNINLILIVIISAFVIEIIEYVRTFLKKPGVLVA